MMVCAHGDVAKFCAERDMHIVDVWTGELSEYAGDSPVLVTDADISEHEYYFLKGELLSRGIELISTRYKDDKLLSEFLVYSNSRRKKKYTGRPGFSDREVIAKILELHSAGLSLRKIQETEGVRWGDGRKLSISTIAKVIESETDDGRERLSEGTYIGYCLGVVRVVCWLPSAPV